jgi:hypothetical protein
VTGEAAVIAAGLKHARRFKQMSLPVLWEMAQGEAKDQFEERLKMHALRVMWDIYEGSSDKEGLRRRLSELNEKALVAQLEKWKKK